MQAKTQRPAGAAAPRAVVGDIGGTHARLALAGSADGSPRILEERIYDSQGVPTFGDVLSRFLCDMKLTTPPPVIVLAAAGPVLGGAVTLTNLGWRVSQQDLSNVGFRRCHLMNDFAALAIGVTVLPPDGTRRIGPDLKGDAHGAMAIVGAGTGFGAAGLLRDRGDAQPFATEGGHVSFAPVDAVEIEVLKILQERFGRVSVERVLSGPGMVNLHQALCRVRGEHSDAAISEPAAIVAAAERGDPAAHETIERFCMIYGSVAGDFALAYGATGGVFLAGGIAPKLLKFLEDGGFRARFEAKGRLSHFVKKVPAEVVLRDDAALLGAAQVAIRMDADAA
jgi:glucokinase